MAPSAPLLMISANQAWNLVNFRKGLIQALIEQGVDIIAAAPYDDVWSPRLEAMGCRLAHVAYDASGLSPHRDAGTLRQIFGLMRQHRPAGWLSWTPKANIYGALAARAAGVTAIPNVSGLGTAFIRRTPLTAAVALLYRFAFTRCPVVLFQNHDDRSLFERWRLTHPDQAHVLPGSGIDLAHFAADRERRAPGHFVMIARLLADKGVREFAQAARILRQQDPSLQFSLVGPLGVDNRTAIGPGEVAGWVEEGTLRHLPPVDDVRPVISGADWIVLPSYREGMSRLLLEAAAMGRPMIATDVPGCRDIVIEGSTGFLAQPRSTASLTAALKRAAATDDKTWHRMANSAREMAETCFSQEKVLSLYFEAMYRADILQRCNRA